MFRQAMTPLAAAACLATSLAAVAPAHAAILTLSNMSSEDDASGPFAADLDATLDFAVTGSTLTLTATNNTDGPDGGSDTGFNISEIYFNTTDNITNLSLTGPAGSNWTLTDDSGNGNPTKADGFGSFDYKLDGGNGNNAQRIDGESAETFTLDITGTGPFSDTDFISELSSPPPPDKLAHAAAKFIEGPDDASAFGATDVIPEPASATLLALGALVTLRRHRA